MSYLLMVYSEDTEPSVENVRAYLGFIPSLIDKVLPVGGAGVRAVGYNYKPNDFQPKHGLLIEVFSKGEDPEGVLDSANFWIVWMGANYDNPQHEPRLARIANSWIRDIGGAHDGSWKAELGMSARIAFPDRNKVRAFINKAFNDKSLPRRDFPSRQ